jgi:hypothetical protein
MQAAHRALGAERFRLADPAASGTPQRAAPECGPVTATLDDSSPISPQNHVVKHDPDKQAVLETGTVRFATERKPREIDLMRAVHTILDSELLRAEYRIPLDYDPRILALLERLHSLSVHFEELIEKHGGTPTTDGFDDVAYAQTFVENTLRDLPDRLGACVARLLRGPMPLGTRLVLRASFRFVELALAHAIGVLVRFQFDEADAILPEYIGVRTDLAGLVAITEGVPREELIEHRIVLFGDRSSRVVITPRKRRIDDEFTHNGWIPSLLFVSDYLAPQMFYRQSKDEWNLDWRCHSVWKYE